MFDALAELKDVDINNPFSSNILSLDQCNSYYKHVTLVINTIEDYISVVDYLQDESVFIELVYRGMADDSWELLPSLGRCEFYFDSAEYEMVRELIHLRPEEFADLPSDFDMIAKMQHFGLPTRLLDFTRNPLVALYFACSDKETKDGRIVITVDSSSIWSHKLIERICSLYRFDDFIRLYLDDFLGDDFTEDEYNKLIARPLMEMPKYSNERMRRQSSLFMVFPNVIKPSRFEGDFKDGCIRKIIQPRIKPIDDACMQNEMCSIIIPSEFKKTILKQLEMLGINEAYLFPEVEYTAKHVKEKYASLFVRDEEDNND